MEKHTILFLAANPLGADRRPLDQEARAIQEELERSGHRAQFELVTRWAARPLDLLRELRKLRPTIVHFSGLGATIEAATDARLRCDVVDELRAVNADRCSGLYFQSTNGGLQFVTTAALEETFGAAGSSVKLVVLNACYSEAQAEALLMYVDCVVGIAGSIRDDAARTFAVGFYGGLGERESVVAAYKQGCAALSLESLPEEERPQLKVRGGTEADEWIQRTSTRVSSHVAQAPVTSRIVQITIVLDTTREKVEAHIGRITSELRRLSGDLTMKITDIEEGSVRLKLVLSPEAAMMLVRLRQNGDLNQICGFDISSILGLRATEIIRAQEQAQGVVTGLEASAFRVSAATGSHAMTIPVSAASSDTKTMSKAYSMHHSSAGSPTRANSTLPGAHNGNPRFSRITGSLDIIPPDDCIASAILKEVARDTRRYFSMWLLVGRHDVDAISAHYRFTGESAVRCDIPVGGTIAASALQHGLAEFLASENEETDTPLVLNGAGDRQSP